MNHSTPLLQGYFSRLGTRFPGTWRVDGATNVTRRGKRSCFVVILLAPINAAFADNPYTTRALANGPGQPFRIHTSMLSRFVVGSVWRDGQLIHLPAEVSEVVKIEPERALYLSMGQELDVPASWPGELLPQSYFPVPDDNRAAMRNAMFAVVPISGASTRQFLIVPCSELLRFYFGVSSRMLNDIFYGTINHDYADFSAGPGPESNRIQIHRKMLLSRPETLVVAMALSSAAARSALLGVHKAVSQGNLLRQKKLEIHCRFPCEGPLSLAVEGKPILVPTADGKGHVWAIFAMRILSSNHQLNADHIDLIDDLIPASPVQQGGDIIYRREDKMFAEDEKLPQLNDLLPANKRARRKTERVDTERFPGLVRVRIRHPKESGKERQGARVIAVTGEEIKTEAYTPGPGNYEAANKGNQGVSEFVTEPPVEPVRVARDLDLFLETCDMIAAGIEKDGWRCRARRINANPLNDRPSYSRFEPTATKSWSSLKGRTRHLVVYEMISVGQRYFYFLEMELKEHEVQNGQSTMLIYRSDYASIEDRDWVTYLSLCPLLGTWATFKNRHNPKLFVVDPEVVDKLFSTINIHPIKHPRSTFAPIETSEDPTTESSGSTSHLRAYDPSKWADKLQTALLSFTQKKASE